MKAPGTKVSAVLRSSPGKRQEAGRSSGPAARLPSPCASPWAPLAPPRLRSRPSPAALRSPPSAGRTPSAPALPGPGPSAPPARRLTGTRPRRVGGAAGPRRCQDPLARTKECGEGARRRSGRRAAPAQAPPRALRVPTLGPHAPPPPPSPLPPSPKAPQAGGARPWRSRSEGGATCSPAGPGLPVQAPK